MSWSLRKTQSHLRGLTFIRMALVLIVSWESTCNKADAREDDGRFPAGYVTASGTLTRSDCRAAPFEGQSCDLHIAVADRVADFLGAIAMRFHA